MTPGKYASVRLTTFGLSTVNDTAQRSLPDRRVLSIIGKSKSPTTKFVSISRCPSRSSVGLLALLLGQHLRDVQPHLHFVRRLVVADQLEQELPVVARPVARLHREADARGAFSRLDVGIRNRAGAEHDVRLQILDLVRQRIAALDTVPTSESAVS